MAVAITRMHMGSDHNPPGADIGEDLLNTGAHLFIAAKKLKQILQQLLNTTLLATGLDTLLVKLFFCLITQLLRGRDLCLQPVGVFQRFHRYLSDQQNG